SKTAGIHGGLRVPGVTGRLELENHAARMYLNPRNGVFGPPNGGCKNCAGSKAGQRPEVDDGQAAAEERREGPATRAPEAPAAGLAPGAGRQPAYVFTLVVVRRSPAASATSRRVARAARHQGPKVLTEHPGAPRPHRRVSLA